MLINIIHFDKIVCFVEAMGKWLEGVCRFLRRLAVLNGRGVVKFALGEGGDEVLINQSLTPL